KVEHLVREKLYKTKEPKERQRLFDEFLKTEGEASRTGILLQLFDDLDTLEAHEEKRLSPPLTEYSQQPRELLIQLHGKPKGVKSKDRLAHVDVLASTALERLIENGLIHDDSPKIDRAARELLVSIRDDDNLALGCMERLIGRGFDKEISEYCK